MVGGMESGTLELRDARPTDLRTIASWISGPEACRLWAGPGLRYPLVPETLWADVNASGDNAFTLIDAEGAVIGFGQAFLRGEGVVHLARIIVAPEWRGAARAIFCAANSWRVRVRSMRRSPSRSTSTPITSRPWRSIVPWDSSRWSGRTPGDSSPWRERRCIDAVEGARGHRCDPSQPPSSGAITRLTMAMTLMRMFIDGPEVSLNGSPTVSPTTVALWTSEPLPP